MDSTTSYTIKLLKRLKQKIYYRDYYYNITKKKKDSPKHIKVNTYDYDTSSDDKMKFYNEIIASNVKVRIDASKKHIVEF